MLVRDHVKQMLESIEAGDEVEVTWNDAVMIEAKYFEDLSLENPVLREKSRAIMKHRGMVMKIDELENGHYVLFLYVKKGRKIMMPRRGGKVTYIKAKNHVLIAIPTALISKIKLVKKGKGKIMGMMGLQVIEPFYTVNSFIPRRRIT